MSIIPALRSLRQEDRKFEISVEYTKFHASLGYVATPYPPHTHTK
jgi:hypothetical protein